jgi:hypothetical protein
MTLGTVAAFGLAAALVGAGDAGLAFACDKATKTAAAATSSSDCSKDATKASAKTASVKTASSCCAMDGAKTTTAGNVHKSMIKSAVVAPGASPVLNTAAFAAGVSGSTVTAGSGSCCESKSASAASASGACDKSAAVKTAGAGGSCDKSTAVKTAGTSGSCEKSTKTAAAAVDEVPYRESKRLVLTGTYECGHCGIGATAECAPMFKTADGKVYPLWNSERVSTLRNDKEVKNVEIATVVKKVDGVKYLDVKSYKAL